MKSQHLKNRWVVSFAALVLAAGVGSGQGAARAAAVPRFNPIENLMEQLQDQYNALRDYWQNELSGNVEALTESLQADMRAALESATGALGLPDPLRVRRDIEANQASAEPDSPLYRGDLGANEIDRQVTRAGAASVLSEAGQQVEIARLEQVQKAVEQAQQAGEAAQSEVVTQNVMKRIAQQQVQQAAILGQLQAESLKDAQRQELANLNLTNLSRAADGQTYRAQSEAVGGGLEVLRRGMMFGLF
ncbi:hypothetical protein [Lusitaniella coriacea]|uniref:hypothetical protein n=1 Tax=Lusitaniella coriacea TaxID=1983105 RepID=UPI003CF314DF